MREPIKIHPFDVYRLLTERCQSLNALVRYSYEAERSPNQFVIDGQVHEQTTDVPATSEALRIIR